MSELTREDVIEHIRNKVSLEYAGLAGVDLRGIDFQKVNLKGADLSECRLAGSRFVQADLCHANLQEADLSGCNLSEADLSHANMNKAILVEVNLANAKMIGAQLHGADLSLADLTNADLAKGDLQRARCSSTDFRNAVLADANFSGAFLRNALFRGANLHGAHFDGSMGLDPAVLKGHLDGDAQPVVPKREGLYEIGLGLVGGEKRVDYGALRPLGGHGAAPEAARPTKYRPPLRRIPALIFTTGGWIRGVFHIPVMHGFLEHLNLSGEMLKLTNVNLPYLKLELRFFGLRRNKALLLLPDCDAKLLNLPEPTADYHVHRVSFLLEGGTVTGSLAIEEDIRVSDYLANHDKFLVLRNCRFGAHDAPSEEEAHFPLLLVNCAAMVGASDERMKQ